MVKHANKKMASFGLLLVLIGGIIAAIGGYLWNKFASKSNADKHREVINQGRVLKEDITQVNEHISKNFNKLKDQSANDRDEIRSHISDEFKEFRQQMTEDQRIFITPSEIQVPANASREILIVVTNNFTYPVFMVVVEAKVIDGDINLSEDYLFLPLSIGIATPKYTTHQIPQLNSKISGNFLMKLSGANYNRSSKIKLSVISYMKEPAPDFTVDRLKDLPDTIRVPGGFIPNIHKNE